MKIKKTDKLSVDIRIIIIFLFVVSENLFVLKLNILFTWSLFLQSLNKKNEFIAQKKIIKVLLE